MIIWVIKGDASSLDNGSFGAILKNCHLISPVGDRCKSQDFESVSNKDLEDAVVFGS